MRKTVLALILASAVASCVSLPLPPVQAPGGGAWRLAQCERWAAFYGWPRGGWMPQPFGFQPVRVIRGAWRFNRCQRWAQRYGWQRVG